MPLISHLILFISSWRLIKVTVKISYSTPFAATSQINVLTHKYQQVYNFEYSFGEWQLISVAGVIKHCQKRILAWVVIAFGPPVCQNEVVAPLVSFRKHIHTQERRIGIKCLPGTAGCVDTKACVHKFSSSSRSNPSWDWKQRAHSTTLLQSSTRQHLIYKMVKVCCSACFTTPR